MRLTRENKTAAGVPAEMPEVIRAYIEKLPPASQNNSREIIRTLWRRSLRNIGTYGWAGAKNAAAEFEKRFGILLDPCEFPNLTGGDGEPDFLRGYDDGVGPRGDWAKDAYEREQDERISSGDIPF